MEPEGIRGSGGEWRYGEMTEPTPTENLAGGGEGSPEVASEIGQGRRDQPGKP